MCCPDLSPSVCPGVKQACCEFLDSQLDPSNCLGIRDFAETHGCADLVRAAEVFSQKHFPEVVQHEEFILLGQGEVEKLIKCDEIQVGGRGPGGGPLCSCQGAPCRVSTGFVRWPWDSVPDLFAY